MCPSSHRSCVPTPRARHKIQLGGSNRFSVGLTSWGPAEFNMAGGVPELVPSAVLGNVRSSHTQTVAGDFGADEVPKHVRTDECSSRGSGALQASQKQPSFMSLSCRRSIKADGCHTLSSAHFWAALPPFLQCHFSLVGCYSNTAGK